MGVDLYTSKYGRLFAHLYIFSPYFLLGSPQGLQFLDGFAFRLIRLAHAGSFDA